MSEPPINRAEFLVSMARRVRIAARKIFSPSVIQCLLAFIAAAAGIGLAVVCWQLGDLLVWVVAIGFIFLSLRFAWELVPFSEQTRERWARNRKLSERYWSYRWRIALWIGLVWSAFRLWQAHVGHHAIDLNTFWVPAAYIVAGAIANGVWLLQRRRLAE